MPNGTIEVFLIGAVGLKDTEVFGKADPYAILTCGKQKLRSNTASNQGSKPIWNQKFSFFIDDSVTELNIKVFNHNILTEDDELGHTVVPLAKVFTDNKLPTTSYSMLRPSGRSQGEVKLSITFAPKVKSGAVEKLPYVAGPYNSTVHGSPYAPEPAVKHDPLIGADGYHPDDSSSKHRSESLRPHLHGDSKHHLPYMDTSTSYARPDSHSGLSHGQVYPSAPFDYEGDPYRKQQYGHGSIPPTLSFHGAVPPASAASVYPPPDPSVHSKPPSHCGAGCDSLAENFTGLNMYGQASESSSHGYYKKPSLSNDLPSSGYPPSESNPHARYPGYPPPNPSIGRPPLGYPPVGDPVTGYPPYSSNPGYPGSAYPTNPYPSHVSAPLHGRGDSGSESDYPYAPAPPYHGSQSSSHLHAGYPK